MDELRRLNATSDSLDDPLGNPIDPGRESRLRDRRLDSPEARRIDLIVSVILTALQVASSACLIFLNVFLPFAFDACGDPSLACDYTLGTVASFVVPLVSFVVLIATIALIVRNRAKSRLSWWIPLAGIAVTVVALLAAIALINIATGRPAL
ncbi:hypothetical protein F1C58_06910 [Glaciihabitans sp. INWT7]|uniref:hypothetical protein n=1 Tax=Glaciihabitans sp. INWT7 TaxID=2596912 RepID=UPI0016254E00|nr:hypothetical protein [Glaciihabitans sp. INWT7]QNE46663.1 hypothetical protein F1C58_06910 [Glaciihabitans sp. INWT7]